MEAIRARGLTKYYGRARGVVNLDLCVEQGEFFGFIGPNGAGKSTTIRAMMGLIRPTSGSVSILGADAWEKNRRTLAKVGYLPAEAAFYPGMRVRDVLRLSADLRGKDCSKQSAMLCDRLQLDAGRKVEELSLGNRKKVAIVCALQHEPELLVLDEPTSGLDPLMQRTFFTLLGERHAQGATVFLSSHVLSEIQRYCSRAAIIREGRIIACDSVEALGQANAKRVSVRGPLALDQLSGVRDLQEADGGVSFLYSGDMRALTAALARGDVRDLTVAEPDLEEVFMHYYEDEQCGEGGGQP